MRDSDGNFCRSTSFSFEELKILFVQGPANSNDQGCDGCGTSRIIPRCFYVEEMGVMAITSNHEESIDFLLEATSHEDKFVRYNAYGHLGDVKAPEKKEAIIIAIESGIKYEEDEIVLGIAKKSLAKLKNHK